MSAKLGGVDEEELGESKRQYEMLSQMGFTNLANRHLLAGAPYLPELIRANIEDHVMPAQQREAEGNNSHKLRRLALERDLGPILDTYLDNVLDSFIKDDVNEIRDKQGGKVTKGELKQRSISTIRMAEFTIRNILRDIVEPSKGGWRELFRRGPLPRHFQQGILEAAGARFFEPNKPYLERNARKEKRSAAHHTVVSNREAKRERWARRTREIGEDMFPAETTSFRDKYS